MYVSICKGTANLGVNCAQVSLGQSFIVNVQTTMSQPTATATQKNSLKVDVGGGRMNQVQLISNTLYFTRSISTGTGTTTGVAYFAVDRSTDVIKKEG